MRDYWPADAYGRREPAVGAHEWLPAPGKCTLTSRIGAAVQRRGGGTPGKRALTDGLPPVQRRAAATGDAGGDVPEIAAAGVAGSGGPIPYRDQIQRAFGRHDVSQVQAFVGGPAADAARAIGAEAYATGDRVAFAREPDLFLIAHEVAHVVQQRGGVQLRGGVGAAGDRYEQHADEVAAAVVRGESVEALLGDPRGGSAPPQVQRKDDASVQLPHVAYEAPIPWEYRKGPFAIQGTFVFNLGADAAASGTESQGRVSGEIGALKPKVVKKLTSAAGHLEAALLEGNLDVTLVDGLTVGIEVTGPEATFDGTPELAAAKLAILVKGDLGHWFGLERGRIVFEAEGSFTIGGKLLARLAEMAAIGDRIADKAKDLERAASELDDLAKQEDVLRKKRIDVMTERNMRDLGHGHDVPDGVRRATRAGYDEKIRQLDEQIADGQKRRAKVLSRARATQVEIDKANKKLTKIYDSLDGKIAKLVGRRHVKAAQKAIGKAVARLVPILNAIGAAQDIVAVANLFADWIANDFSLPELGGGGPDAYGKADAPGSGDGDGTGAGQPGGTTQAPGAEPGSGADGTGDGARARDGDHDAPDRRGLHPGAQRVLDAVEKKRGFRLDEDQIAAVGYLVPADLTEEQLDAVVERVRARGVRPRDGSEMLAVLGEAIREATAAQARITVDGEEVDTEGRPVAQAAPAAPKAGPGKRKRKKGKQPKDERVSLDPAEVATWFEADGDALVTNERYELWRIDALTELEQVVAGVRYMVTEIEATGQITPQGLWDVRVALRFVEAGGDRRQDEQFRWLLAPGTGAAAPVVSDSNEPLERFVHAGPTPGDPPTVTMGALVSFPDYDLEIVHGAPLAPSAGADDGSWSIHFWFRVDEVRGQPGDVVDDRGVVIPLEKNREFRKTLDVRPRGRH